MGQMPIVTRQSALKARARGNHSHTRGAGEPLVGGHAILTSYSKVSCRSYVYYGIIHTGGMHDVLGLQAEKNENLRSEGN